MKKRTLLSAALLAQTPFAIAANMQPDHLGTTVLTHDPSKGTPVYLVVSSDQAKLERQMPGQLSLVLKNVNRSVSYVGQNDALHTGIMPVQQYATEWTACTTAKRALNPETQPGMSKMSFFTKDDSGNWSVSQAEVDLHSALYDTESNSLSYKVAISDIPPFSVKNGFSVTTSCLDVLSEQATDEAAEDDEEEDRYTGSLGDYDRAKNPSRYGSGAQQNPSSKPNRATKPAYKTRPYKGY